MTDWDNTEERIYALLSLCLEKISRVWSADKLLYGAFELQTLPFFSFLVGRTFLSPVSEAPSRHSFTSRHMVDLTTSSSPRVSRDEQRDIT